MRTLYWILWPLVWIYAPLRIRVRCIVVVEGQGIVLVKNRFGPGVWQLPGGGIGLGEKPADAAVREVKEELGIALDPTSLVEVPEVQVVRQFGLTMRYRYFVVQIPRLADELVLGPDVVDYKIWSKNNSEIVAPEAILASKMI